MEYERALFRVYDRSMEGLRSPSTRSVCWYAQKMLLVISAGLFATLFLLHHNFVEEPGCIASLIREAAVRERLLLPPVDNVTVIEGGKRKDSSNDDDGDEEVDNTRVVFLPSGDAIPHDVMIGIAIGEGGGGGSRSHRMWRLRGSRSEAASPGKRRLDADQHSPPGLGRDGVMRRLEEESRSEGDGEGGGEREGEAGDELMNSSPGNASVAEDDSFAVDYIFSFEPSVLMLPQGIRKNHQFRWLNLTLEPGQCLQNVGSPARLLASRVVGYDVIIVNMLMMSSWAKGMLENTETHAQWFWPKRKALSLGWFDRIVQWASFKLEVLLSSMLAFVLISTVTAMTVRTLLSSGVVIIFPLVMLMERMGLTIVGMQQTLALSYPWLGMPIEHLRNRNKPVMPFIMGHIMQMLVLYFVYNASLLAWSLWLYGKPMTTTTPLQLWLYGMVMLWEYFALIFVRSRLSIVFFSRTAAISFLAFHVYYYHFHTGYFAIAAGACFTAMFAVKLYVLQYLELPAYMSGEISHDEPRAHYVELPWSTWDAALPPMWSLFIPPNASTVGVYGDAVPDRPGTVEGGNNGEPEADATPSARGGLRSRGRGRGRSRGVGDATGRRRSRGRGGASGGRGRGGGGDDGGEGVEMATRRRRASGSDIEQG